MLSADCHIPEHGDGGTERRHQARWLVLTWQSCARLGQKGCMSYSWARWLDREKEMQLRICSGPFLITTQHGALRKATCKCLAYRTPATDVFVIPSRAHLNVSIAAGDVTFSALVGLGVSSETSMFEDHIPNTQQKMKGG